jgi:predicted DNA-binding ribbon-helix-helix protein
MFGSLMQQQIFGLSKERFVLVKRSVRLYGHATSVQLEAEFWSVIDEIAVCMDMSVPDLMRAIYREMQDTAEPVQNFSSTLRTVCVIYLRDGCFREPDQDAAIEANRAGEGCGRELSE